MSQQTDTDLELYNLNSIDKDGAQPSKSKAIPNPKVTGKGSKTIKQTTPQGETRTSKTPSGISDKLKAVNMWKYFIQHPKKPTEDFVLVECILYPKRFHNMLYIWS